jgi:hypothetical protein
VAEQSPAGEDLETLKARILAETARIPWRELQRFFAGGRAISVSPGLDLVEVASAMALDDGARVENWMSAGKLGQVADSRAAEWYEANVLMWAVVLKPWVLVQPIMRDAL